MNFQSFSGIQNEIQENCVDIPSDQFSIANDYSNSSAASGSLAMNCDVPNYGYISNISNDGLQTIDRYNTQYNTTLSQDGNDYWNYSDQQLQVDQRGECALPTYLENICQGDYNSDSADSLTFYSSSNVTDNMGAASIDYGTQHEKEVVYGDPECGVITPSVTHSSSHEERISCLVPEGGLRTSRIAYRELSDDMKMKHTRYLNNERARKYRERNYQMLKQTEDELEKLQLQNETLHTTYEHLKQKRDQILSILPDPSQNNTQQTAFQDLHNSCSNEVQYQQNGQEKRGLDNLVTQYSMSTDNCQTSFQKVPQSSYNTQEVKEEDTVIKCNCREGIKCQTNKCSCYKRYRTCNSRCHKGQPCENL